MSGTHALKRNFTVVSENDASQSRQVQELPIDVQDQINRYVCELRFLSDGVSHLDGELSDDTKSGFAWVMERVIDDLKALTD